MKLLEENARLKEMAAEAQRLKEELERVMQAIDGRATAGTARSSMESVQSPHRATAGSSIEHRISQVPAQKEREIQIHGEPEGDGPGKMLSWYV